jgi:8-oxo-dGTP pyrophosphatase MutT (NUDIX family)
MTGNRTSLMEELSAYQTLIAEEGAYAKKFLQLLKHADAFQRHHLPGHITGSAWIVDETRKYTLLTHHAKLNRWLQPGGHADGDENVLNVALREAMEETGLTSIKPLSPNIFDIDVHPIPARKDFPEHEHYDIRYLFVASKEEKFIITAESHDLKWVLIEELEQYVGNNVSVLRMAEKVTALKER